MGNPRRDYSNDEIEDAVETIAINQALSNAAGRCARIAEGERLMGHPESAATYYTLAAEFQEDLRWLYGYMAKRHTEILEEEGVLLRG